jgi:hypothetical protein
MHTPLFTLAPAGPSAKSKIMKTKSALDALDAVEALDTLVPGHVMRDVECRKHDIAFTVPAVEALLRWAAENPEAAIAAAEALAR